MPNVTASPRAMSDGQIMTEFTDTIGTAPVTYTYTNQQEGLTVTNKGAANLTLTANGTSYTILPGQQQSIDTSLTSFAIVSANGVQSFMARATNLDTSTLKGHLLTGGHGFAYNIDEGLRSFRNALADIDANPVKIACVGDSVTFGSFASDIQNTNWVGRLRKVLQTKLGDVGAGTYPTPAGGVTNAASPWVMAGTWNYNSANGLFGRFMSATGTSATATVTFTGTSIDLIYTKGTSGSVSGVSITIDGVAQAVPSFYNSSVVYGNVQTYSGLTAGSHTLVITAPASGSVYIEGLIAYNPTASAPKGCYVFNCGSPNAQASWHIPNVSKLTSTLNAHLYIIALGINDALNSPATYYANMGTLISGYQNAGASVLLIPYYMINDASATNNANYVQIVEQQYQLADQYNCGLIDIYSRWGKSWNAAQTVGLMGGGSYNGVAGTDKYHPSDKGFRDIASAIALQLIGQVS